MIIQELRFNLNIKKLSLKCTRDLERNNHQLCDLLMSSQSLETLELQVPVVAAIFGLDVASLQK